MPSVVRLVIRGPVDLAAGGIVVCEERKMWKRVQDAVKKVSQSQPTLESVDRYHH